MKNIIKRSLGLFVFFAGVALMGVFWVNMALAELPGKGVTVRFVDQNLAEEEMQENILIEGLKELGYKIAPVLHMAQGVTTAHLAVAQGDADLYPVHWVPLHKTFVKPKKMVVVGHMTPGALQGYLIDKKTAEKYHITNVDQLKDPKIAKIFDSDGDGKADLAGCVPGWGCERVIEHHLDAYGLRKTVHHNQGSYFALIADVIARYKAGKPILYYTWTPLWVSGVLVPGKDVEWLTVPFTSLPKERTETAKDTTLPDGRNLGFAVNTITPVVNKKFLNANPAARKFFELVRIPINDVSAENLLIHKGEKTHDAILGHAKDWISKHRSEFNRWINEAKNAAR